MATTILTDAEYQFIVAQEKDLLAKAADDNTTPRAATHYRAAAKLHSNFLALENGKRAATSKRNESKAEIETQKLRKQEARLKALQAKMSSSAQTPNAGGNTGRSKTQATA